MLKLFVLGLLSISSLLMLAGCNKEEKEMNKISLFTDLYTNKSMYAPSEQILVNIDLRNTSDKAQTGEVYLEVYHLGQMVIRTEKETTTVEPLSNQYMTFELEAPARDFTGYHLVARYENDTDEDLITTGLDISSDWKKFPRYGYLVDYTPKSTSSIEDTIKRLTKYHINGLQFYDWHYMHHRPLPFDEAGKPFTSWLELSNRTVSYKTVETYINKAHDANMVAMNYNLLFGTFDNPQADGVDLAWGLYKDQQGNDIDYHGLPSDWQTSRLLLMDPNNVHWQDYIIEQERRAIETLGFDGWHVDQLGSRGTRYDALGNQVNLVNGFIDLLQKADTELNTRLVFNAVDGYGNGEIARKLNVDALYQEVWSDKAYADLKRIIDFGFMQTDYEKSTILAAYMNYGARNQKGLFSTPAVLLTNATIFASGGSHLALGDTGMLSSEYFPSDNLKMSLDLQNRLRNYYSFMVAYQNLLRDNTRNTMLKVEMDDTRLSALGAPDSVWYFGKETDDYKMLHLINLIGNQNDWRDDELDKNDPVLLENKKVRIFTDELFEGIYLASPDQAEGLMQALDVTTGENEYGDRYIEFVMPSLEYWNMIVMKR